MHDGAALRAEVVTAMDRDKSPIIGSSPSIDQLAAALRANDAYIAHLSNDEVDHMAFDLHAALARDISSDPVDDSRLVEWTCEQCGQKLSSGSNTTTFTMAVNHAADHRQRVSSDPVDWPPPNGAYHWEWCKRVNTRGMNAKCDCGGPEAKARAERDISSDRDAIAEWFHRHTEGTDERVCYHYNQYKWDCREMADDLIESLPKRDRTSVTGSEQRLLAQIERLAVTTKASPGAGIETVGQMVRLALPHIQRKAVDAFIRNELPRLLTRAMPDAHEDVPPEIAAKIAELRNSQEEKS